MSGKYSVSLEISGNACDQVYEKKEKKGNKNDLEGKWALQDRWHASYCEPRYLRNF